MVDSVEPVPFGTSVVLFGLVHATLLYGRQRLPREGAIFGTIVALFANLFLFIALSFLLIGANPRPGEAWLRLFVDLLASQVVILVIAPWFLALQARTMELAQIHPETGRRLWL
jgi:rod shape-determining protein MreD